MKTVLTIEKLSGTNNSPLTTLNRFGGVNDPQSSVSISSIWSQNTGVGCGNLLSSLALWAILQHVVYRNSLRNTTLEFD